MINIGLIGFGYWGQKVEKNIHANKDLNLYSICDYKEDRLEKAFEKATSKKFDYVSGESITEVY